MAGKKTIAVVGAGPLGLTAACTLLKLGLKVDIFEMQQAVGGIVQTMPSGSSRIEKTYCHAFSHDHDLIEMVEEMGLSGGWIWGNPRNAIYANQSTRPFSSPLDLLFFKPLSLAGRFKLGSLYIKAKMENDWRKLDKISAKEWVVKNAGSESFNCIWGPLLYSKFDFDAEDISAAWLCSKLKLRGSSRGKLLQSEKLGYLKGSFGTLYDALESKIRTLGGGIFLGEPVKQIMINPQEKVEVAASGLKRGYDAAIITCAPEEAIKIMDGIPPGYSQKASKIKYKANLCLYMEVDRPVSEYYWTSIADREAPFVSVIEHTNFIKDGGYGSNILYISRYLDEANPLFSAEDGRIKAQFIGYLNRLYPGFEKVKIKHANICRTRYSQPVIAVGYADNLLPFETPLKDVYLSCMAQIYPEDRGQNYSIRLGKKVANIVAQRTVG